MPLHSIFDFSVSCASEERRGGAFLPCSREATPKHNSDHAVVAFVFGCRRDATRKHDSDQALIGTDVLRRQEFVLQFSKQFHPPVVPACASSAYGSHVQQLLTSISMNTRSPQCLTVAGRRVSSRRERLILRQGSGLVS